MVGTTAKVKSVKVDLKKTLLLCTLEVKFRLDSCVGYFLSRLYRALNASVSFGRH
jgi:hypothetical protein